MKLARLWRGSDDCLSNVGHRSTAVEVALKMAFRKFGTDHSLDDEAMSKLQVTPPTPPPPAARARARISPA